MRTIFDPKEIRQQKDSIVLIGKFDGFHRGHRKLLEEAIQDRGSGSQTVLFTFAAMPRTVITGRGEAGITTREERRALAEEAGADVFIEIPFTEELMRMSAEDFLMKVLIGKLRMKEIVAGPDCAFGYQRRGNVRFLQEQETKGGYRLKVVEKERYGGDVISSHRIRCCLSEGKVEDVEAMLGRPYGFCSPVLHGRRLGSRLGFPTINQEISPERYLPAFGVYTSEVILEGKKYPGLSNVGIKPTISGRNAAGVETYIYGFAGDAYGKTVRVELKHFVRPERKFGSLEELQEQVRRDCRENDPENRR